MQVVYEAANLIDAYLVRHALEAGGIPVFVRGEALVGGIGELPACGLVAVCVPDYSFAQARDVISKLPLLSGDTDGTDAAATEADMLTEDMLSDGMLPGCPQAG